MVVLLATTALVTPLSCKLEPRVPELVYSPNSAEIEKNDDLAQDEAAQAQLEGLLQFLFGTPQAPSYLSLQGWGDDEFYPDDWGYDFVATDDDWWDRLVDSNRRAYARQIEAIKEGDFDAVTESYEAPGVWDAWLDALANKPDDPDAEFDEGGSWRDYAVSIFENYYPTLRDSAELYRTQCFHCHGAEGGGNGSTAEFLNPRPRDYRHGTFKWTALRDKSRPRHEDLFRILAEGIRTTAMPNFRRLTDAQIHGLVDYVRFLAVRGETERLLISDFNEDERLSTQMVEENYQLVIDRWHKAADLVITYDGEVPRATPERIEHGRYLFTTPGEEGGANCVACHGTTGLGDGPSVNDPDNSVDDWGNPIKPRNLQSGTFRFGRRPIDLFRRIYVGINGTPMPEHIGQQITDSDGTVRPLNEEDVWDMAFFVRSLSTEPMESAGTSGPDREHSDH
jgi:mono/diheme cytochrome c family protein